MSASQFPLALKVLKDKKPVRYDKHGQMIFTNDGNMLLDVRGWGWIQKLDNAAKTQDEIGEFVAHLINSNIQ